MTQRWIYVCAIPLATCRIILRGCQQWFRVSFGTTSDIQITDCSYKIENPIILLVILAEVHALYAEVCDWGSWGLLWPPSGHLYGPARTPWPSLNSYGSCVALLRRFVRRLLRQFQDCRKVRNGWHSNMREDKYSDCCFLISGWSENEDKCFIWEAR